MFTLVTYRLNVCGRSYCLCDVYLTWEYKHRYQDKLINNKNISNLSIVLYDTLIEAQGAMASIRLLVERHDQGNKVAA